MACSVGAENAGELTIPFAAAVSDSYAEAATFDLSTGELDTDGWSGFKMDFLLAVTNPTQWTGSDSDKMPTFTS